jgi:hypothetical protein
MTDKAQTPCGSDSSAELGRQPSAPQYSFCIHGQPICAKCAGSWEFGENYLREWADYWRTRALAAEAAAAAERERLHAALLRCARQAEALKRDCSADPESPQAVRNSQYQSISTTAHIALGTIRGPEAA